jgi:hypothetical protein
VSYQLRCEVVDETKMLTSSRSDVL